MALVRVWAPEAEHVELDGGNRREAMISNENNWWTIDTPHVAHGTDYAFYVNGEGPFPDPRSPWQPLGVHSPSRWLDHSRFSWNDSHWHGRHLSGAVVYELHVGTFTPEGTFIAVVDKLDYLTDLGITHIELMPVAEFSGSRGWGYDGVDLYAPHHGYGGPEGLKRLVDACHDRGLAVLLDVVYNHLGPEGNYLSKFGPYFTERYRTPWGEAVNLDGRFSDEVRRFFIDNALMWLRDYHIDGLRIDAVHAILDISPTHFLEDLARAVRLLESHAGRHKILVAENDLNDPRIVHPFETGGYGFDAQWNEDFHHALHALLTGERKGYYCDFGRMADLAKALTKGYVYDGRYSEYRKRRHGRSASGLSGHHFVGFLQNHDQIGNRAVGERSSHLLSPDQIKIGATLVLMAPFIPLLFQGEEWGCSSPFLYFTDHQDPELGEAVSKERRREFAAFGWDPDKIPDPQDEETFLRSKLNWREREQHVHQELQAWYRALIALRCSMPDLTDGRMETVQVNFDEAARWIIAVRSSMVIAANCGDQHLRLTSSAFEEKKILLASKREIRKNSYNLDLPGRSVAVLGIRERAEERAHHEPLFPSPCAAKMGNPTTNYYLN